MVYPLLAHSSHHPPLPPPQTPHRSYSAQTRSQNEEKNPPPKPYLPLQTRTRHRRSHRPHLPMLMRGTTPPTMRSPPHQSRPIENPPNLQPATVGEEERGWRDPTSKRTSMRAASDCTPSRLNPTRHVPRQQQQAGGNEDIVSSATGPGGTKHSQSHKAPPPRDAAKMSPRISIGPEPVLAAHAPSPPAAGSHCPAREGSAPH